MNYFLFILFIFFSSCLFGQRYYNAGIAFFKSSGMGTKVGPTIGFHIPSGTNATVGATADFFVSDRNEVNMIPVYFDLSLYFKKLESTVTPFISLRPGYVIAYDNLDNNRYTGSLAMSAYLGGLLNPGKIGATLGIGYSYLEIISRNENFKLTKRIGGISFFINVAFLHKKK